MQTGLDRRTFLTRAAVAGGGLLSIGAVERLVARDALGQGRRTSAEPYGPLRRVADQRGVEVLALPRGLQLRDVQPYRLEDVGREPDAAGARRHGLVRGADASTDPVTATAITVVTARATCPQQRGPQPGGHGRRPAGGPLGGIRPDGIRRHHDAGLRRAPARARAGLRQPQRHDGELRGRHLLPPPLLAHRRGDRGRAGFRRSPGPVREAPRLPVPDAGRPRPERARGRRSRSSPPAGSRTRRRPSTSGPASSTRPRTPAPASAPGSTATPRTTPTT